MVYICSIKIHTDRVFLFYHTDNNVKVKITNSGVDKFTNFGETSSQ